MDSKHREPAAPNRSSGHGRSAGASNRLESSKTQMMSVDFRSKMSGGGRSAFCATCDSRTLLRSMRPDRSDGAPTISIEDVVVLESVGWEKSGCESKLHPQSSWEFDSRAGDELERSSWHDRSAVSDESVPKLSKQARAQRGACRTKNAATIAKSHLVRLIGFPIEESC